MIFFKFIISVSAKKKA